MKKPAIVLCLVRFILLISLLFSPSSCDRIFLVGFARNIPMADGVRWKNFQAVIAPGSEGTYDTDFVADAAVINDQGYGKMWYRGRSLTPDTRIIYCESF